MTTQPAQRDGASLLLSLTRDPARIEARIRQAALLEAADVPAPLVRALVKITTTGRLTHEDIHVMRDTGIDIDGMVTAIQRADHTLRATQDHATAPQAHPMTTPPPYEIRYATLADGTIELDEVIARDAHVHLEKMNDAQWWLGIDLPDGTHIAVNLGVDAEGEYAWAEVEEPDARPAGCCGKCPPIEGGGYDCTCDGNPRCPNGTGATPTDGPERDETGVKTAKQAADGRPEGRDADRPAERRWRIRRYGAMWRATDPNCRGQGEDGCRITATWTDAVDHVNNELRDRALAAIENQEATSQPQEDQ